MQIAEPVAGVAPKTQPGSSSAGASFDMLLFGATGDLALRKLVPALYRRHLAGHIGAGARIVGVARTAQNPRFRPRLQRPLTASALSASPFSGQ